MNDKELQREPWNMDRKDAIDVILAFSVAYSACFRPFLVIGTGTHSMAYGGPWALLLLLMMAQAVPPMRIYFLAWLTACIVQRFLHDKKAHSLYMGWPWLGMRFRFAKSEMGGWVVTAFIVSGIGVALSRFNEAMSWFFLLGGPAILLHVGLIMAKERKRMHRMRDAAIEQRMVMEMMREKKW